MAEHRWRHVQGASCTRTRGPQPDEPGKKGSNRHLLEDGRGVPLSLAVTGTHEHDVTQIGEVLQAIMVKRKRPNTRRSKHLCADAGYRGKRALELIESHGYIAHVVGRRTEAQTKQRNPKQTARRWVAEVCHRWFNHFQELLVQFGLSGNGGLAPIEQASRARSSSHHHLLVNRDLPGSPAVQRSAHPFRQRTDGDRAHAGARHQHPAHAADRPEALATFFLQQEHRHHGHEKECRGSGNAFHQGSEHDAGRPNGKKAVSGAVSCLGNASGSGAAVALDFAEGQTEVWRAPPAGNCHLRLEMIDNLDPTKRMANAATASVRVE